MKSNKYVTIFLILIFLLFHARMVSAIDIRQGVNIFSGEGSSVLLVIPIRLESLSIEPGIAYSGEHGDSKNKYSNQKADNDGSGIELLAGLYLRKGFSNEFEEHDGARLGTDQSLYNQMDEFNSKIDARTDIVVLTPALGLQYFFNKQFSMGVDAGLRLEQATSDSNSVGSSDVISDRYEAGDFKASLESRVIVRALF